MVHDIKRLGGGWQYGPQNKTITHLKKPLYVVKRTKRDAPRIDFNLFGIAHKADLAKGKGEVPFILIIATISFQQIRLFLHQNSKLVMTDK